uniref:Uncharacterized protein n=1 Tax=Cyclopterus lumpus TaxID=8103 RepID=A0A8C2YWY0_CYCLU
MMKTGRVVSCCVALFLALTSVSEINFGQSVPKHSLLLLWFANAVDIDRNNIMRLTFDPESRAYGSHHYGNYEGLLDDLSWGNVGYQYYTLGSLNQESSMQLPPYVVRPPTTGYEGNNMDRIIIRIRRPNTGQRVTQMIDQVYITQHLNNQREYDPDHTYRITTDLLRQIREFSVGEDHQQLLRLSNQSGSTREQWPGVFLFDV